MISEGCRDTENWSNHNGNSAVIKTEEYLLIFHNFTNTFLLAFLF